MSADLIWWLGQHKTFALFFWMNKRWHQMGNIERLVVYGCVFLFFPGMVVFAPFLNLRMNGQGEI